MLYYRKQDLIFQLTVHNYYSLIALFKTHSFVGIIVALCVKVQKVSSQNMFFEKQLSWYNKVTRNKISVTKYFP